MLIKIKDFIFKIIYILLLVYLFIFVPTFWKYKPLAIISGSMQPTLKTGGLMYYTKIDLDDFDNGDIIVYQTKDHIISHRLVDKTEDGFITKGDANNSVDSNIVKKEQVLGKGTNWSIAYLGAYADFIYSNKYILYILVAMTVLDLCNDNYINHKKKVGELIEKRN